MADQGNTLAPEAGWIQYVLRNDSQTVELLWELFQWARDWKARARIRPINIRKWFTSPPRRIAPKEIQDILIFHTANSTLIIYPEDMNEIGSKLPNSGYRVYRIPRCMDIKTRFELETIFKQIESIKVAEEIAEKLIKGEDIEDISWGGLDPKKAPGGLILNPEIFFWVQNILREKIEIHQKRFGLERRLLLTVLSIGLTDLDPQFKDQLEKFLPSCCHAGNWLDLAEADRFILTTEIHKNPQILDMIRKMADYMEDIYRKLWDSQQNVFSSPGHSIEMNAPINIFSSLIALKKVISESETEDFVNTIKITARLLSYLTKEREGINLLILLDSFKGELEEHKRAGIKGLEEILEEVNKALQEKDSLEDFRKGILGDILIEFFRRIPKADIHHHLDGCISPELAFKIIQKYPNLMELYGNPKSPEDLKPYIEFNYKGEGEINWDDLWPKFALFTHILNTGLDAVRTVFRESSLEDFYNDGLTLIEQKVSIITPGQDPDIDPAEVLEAAVRGLIEAEEATGGKLQTGLIPCIWKTPQHILGSRYEELAKREQSDPGIIIREAREEALRQVKIVVELKKRWEREKSEYAQYIIGIDTVGDEKDYIRDVTAPALQYAAENGLNITEHLGENWNPGELKQALLRIKQGIESGIIKHIGHATALGIETEDGEIRGLQEEIKELIRKNNIHVETCPSSNKLLAPERSIPRYQDHPVVRFYRELGNVSINTDDSWILHTRGLSGEFMKVWLANPELKYSDIQRIIENGFQASFIKAKPGPINPQELIKRGLDEILELVSSADHEILAFKIFDLLRYSFVVSKGSPTFEEWLKDSILSGISRKLQDTLAKKGVAWLATRGVVKDIVEITEILKGGLSETEKEKLIDKLTEELKEVFYTPLTQYRYAEGAGLDLKQLGEQYPTLKSKVEELNIWLREQGEILQVRLNLDHQGTFFDLANAIEQRILFGSDPHIMYDLHDDNGGLGIKITEANWVGYARKAGLFPWVAQVRPPKPGTTDIMIHEVKGVTSVSVCFDYFSYYGMPVLENEIRKDKEAFRSTEAEIEDKVNQIIDGLMLEDLDVRLFSMSISPAYIYPDQAELIVDKLIEGIQRYVTQRKDSGWYQKRLDDLIPSPLLEDDPVVIEFIKEAFSTKGPEEIQQLDDKELCQRLYYALEYPGIGLPGRPAPQGNWWRHVAIHLKGAAIGGERFLERSEALRKAIEKHQSISNLLQEWLRRNRSIDLKELPPVRPLSDTEQVEAGLELMRSS